MYNKATSVVHSPETSMDASDCVGRDDENTHAKEFLDEVTAAEASA